MFSLQDLMEAAEAQADIHLLGKTGGGTLITSYALVSATGEVVIVGCIWGDDDDKTMTFAALRAYCALHNIVKLGFTGMMWASVKRADEEIPPGFRPADDPNRKEVVLAAATDGINTMSSVREVRRDAGGVVVELMPMPTDGAQFGGPLVDGILPVGVPR